MEKIYERSTDKLCAYVANKQLRLPAEFYINLFKQYRSIVVESFEDDFSTEMQKYQDDTTLLMELSETRKEPLSLVDSLFFEKIGIELSSARFSKSIQRPFRAESMDELLISMIIEARDTHLETLDKVLKLGAVSKITDQPFTKQVFSRVKKILLATASQAHSECITPIR
ncbi:hypothetical protein MACH09_34840 [Vibrio sp. MACH09]|uniref:hypothetical protein n=1 Tax=Vibrio sp. MACH09 TaxID=3025122 RepID=UPI00279245C8|nr:hypothetical protein [Vibrio sp. MACH09]GLO62976.1 hypothetical protein MACH09_34840 [Vibrio sp. MACH09]